MNRNRISAGLGIAGIALALAACGSAATHKDGTSGASGTSSPAAAAATAPATAPAPVAPNPDGTFIGSCDYTLMDNFSEAHAATFTGEVDLSNTGNIGTVNRVRISWPQEGFAPITMFRHVRVAAGAQRAVRFHYAATQAQIGQLQAWQSGHNFRDGCRYRTTIVSTYGKAR